MRALETPERTAAAAVERARPPEPNSRARRESAPAAPPYARTRSAPRIPLTFPSSSRARSPLRPDAYDWESHYPEFFAKHRKKSADAEASGDAAAGPYSPPLVRFADVGCGFGGLLVRLSPLFPDDLAVGMEIRDKVSQYVKERCVALRREHPGSYENISCIRTNSMKYLPNFFQKGQLTKLFFLFPDPHFKTANHRRRIIQRSLLSEYAYALAVGGIVYTITDVEELGRWMAEKIEEHPMFERLTEEECKADPVVPLLFTGTEEGQKGERNEGNTFLNVFRRVEGPK